MNTETRPGIRTTKIRRAFAARLRRTAQKIDPQPIGQTIYWNGAASGNAVHPHFWQQGGQTIC